MERFWLIVQLVIIIALFLLVFYFEDPADYSTGAIDAIRMEANDK